MLVPFHIQDLFPECLDQCAPPIVSWPLLSGKCSSFERTLPFGCYSDSVYTCFGP